MGSFDQLAGLPCTLPGVASPRQISISYSERGVAMLTCERGGFSDFALTVLDTRTGLMWEKKVEAAGCLHCVADKYDWFAATGSWIDAVNQEQFGGYTDWRLPTFDELQTILTAPFPCPLSPCVDAVFYNGTNSSTVPLRYWSSTTVALNPLFARWVNFGDGSVGGGTKDNFFWVRAVRGGP